MNRLYISYMQAAASEEDIFIHLQECSENFHPPLSEKVDVLSYSRKLHRYAVTFEAWVDRKLVGLVAAYLNDMTLRSGYITNVSVLMDFNGNGIASELMRRCIRFARDKGFEEINLEVHEASVPAVNLYTKHGFIKVGNENEMISMRLTLQ